MIMYYKNFFTIAVQNLTVISCFFSESTFLIVLRLANENK